jgi:hypothetical protein
MINVGTFMCTFLCDYFPYVNDLKVGLLDCILVNLSLILQEIVKLSATVTVPFCIPVSNL